MLVISFLMSELDVPCTAAEVAVHCPALIDAIIVDEQDAGLAAEIARAGVQVTTSNIVMKSVQDKIDLADAVLSFARKLAVGLTENWR